MGSKTGHSLVVYNDDGITFHEIVEMFRVSLGIDPTQAQQCAILIHNRGSYPVKTFKKLQDAEAVYEYLTKNGVKATIKSN